MTRPQIHFFAVYSAILSVICAAITAQVLTDFLPSLLSDSTLRDLLWHTPGINLLATAIISAIMIFGIADFWRRDLAKLGR